MLTNSVCIGLLIGISLFHVFRNRKVLRFIFSNTDSKFSFGDTWGHTVITFRRDGLPLSVKIGTESISWLIMNN